MFKNAPYRRLDAFLTGVALTLVAVYVRDNYINRW